MLTVVYYGGFHTIKQQYNASCQPTQLKTSYRLYSKNHINFTGVRKTTANSL